MTTPHLDGWRDRAAQGHSSSDLVDLGPGYPDNTLLPGAWLADALTRAMAATPRLFLGYGVNDGPEPLRQMVADRFGADVSEVITTAGSSSAISQMAASLEQIRTPVLVEATTYDLAAKIFLHRGVELHRLPPSPLGVDPDDLATCAATLRRATGQTPALYVIPTFHNPTGRVLTPEICEGVINVAGRLGVQIIEDQAYIDLHDDHYPPPTPLRTVGHGRADIVSLYSFSKSVAPGLRTGALVADREQCRKLAADGERDSGGGPSHFIAAALSEAAYAGHLARHIDQTRAILQTRRRLAQGLLDDGLPADTRARPSRGGYFIWIDLPPHQSDIDVQQRCRANGLDIAPGRKFGDAGGIRISVASNTSGTLAEAIPRLCSVLTS